MGKINFNIGEGGLGRDLPNKDNYSGFIFDNTTKPSGFGTESVKKVRTLKDAEDLGITVADHPEEHYHISNFFAMANKISGLAQGHLWILFFDSATTAYDGSQLETLQNTAGGEIRRIGVNLVDSFATAMVTDSQTKADALADENKPVSVLISADYDTTISALPDLRALTAPRVSVVIGMDKGGKGNDLSALLNKSVTCIGATLGAKAFGATHENLGWIGKFDFATDGEFNSIMFGTGEEFDTQQQTALDDLTARGYIYLKKEVGLSGTYIQDTPTATKATSDYAYWENQEVIDKAVRLVRAKLLPLVNSPLYVATDTGLLSEDTIQVFKTEAFSALDAMAIDGNISTKSDGTLDKNSVIIDPAQDVLSNSKVIVTIKIVPVGVAREIVVNIGFTTKI